MLLAAALPDIEPSAELMAFAEAEETAIEVGRVDDAVEINVRMWASHSTPGRCRRSSPTCSATPSSCSCAKGAESDELDPPRRRPG